MCLLLLVLLLKVGIARLGKWMHPISPKNPTEPTEGRKEEKAKTVEDKRGARLWPTKKY